MHIASTIENDGYTHCFFPFLMFSTFCSFNFTFISHYYVYHVQVQTEFQGLSAEIMYDMVHDSSYRRNWDDAVLEDEDICRVEGACSDIGYYASNNTIPLFYDRLVYEVCVRQSWVQAQSLVFQALSKVLQIFFKHLQKFCLSIKSCKRFKNILSTITQTHFIFVENRVVTKLFCGVLGC